MANSTVACCNAIVPELLNQHNYKHWKSRVETYLLSEDLWDVVKAEPPRPDAVEAEHKAWTKKNAKALHAIKISCGTDMFSFISEVGTAKGAWEVLEEDFKARLMLELEEKERQQRDTIMEADTTIDAGQARNEDLQALQTGPHQQPLHVLNPGDHNFDRYKLFHNYVRNGDWDNANKCLLELELDAEHALRARDWQGNTALHVAVLWGHVHIVKELVQLMTQQDLEIKSNFGSTPLGKLIRDSDVEEHVMIEMARYMVEKNNTLVTIPVPVQNNIPVAEACGWGKWELARYLYSVTPPQALMGPHGAILISFCLGRMKMLDMAFNLLRRCPILALDAQASKPPMLELANIRAAFLSGTRLTCWQKWIYNCVHIKAVDLNLHDISINIPNLEEDHHKINFICSVYVLRPATDSIDDNAGTDQRRGCFGFLEVTTSKWLGNEVAVTVGIEQRSGAAGLVQLKRSSEAVKRESGLISRGLGFGLFKAAVGRWDEYSGSVLELLGDIGAAVGLIGVV